MISNLNFQIDSFRYANGKKRQLFYLSVNLCFSNTYEILPPGADDSLHPNKVRISVRVPHRDGMLPVVSTRRLSNFELSLSKDGTRLAVHRCSNLLDFDEVS